MTTDRRGFLRASAAVSGMIGLGGAPLAGLDVLDHPADLTASSGKQQAQAPLRVLVLGGTGFIGPYQIRYAIERGHTVTMFTAGERIPDCFPTWSGLQATGTAASMSCAAGNGTSSSTTRGSIRDTSGTRRDC